MTAAGQVGDALKLRSRMDGLGFAVKSDGFSGFTRSNGLEEYLGKREEVSVEALFYA
jgi:hypothetical protein